MSLLFCYHHIHHFIIPISQTFTYVFLCVLLMMMIIIDYFYPIESFVLADTKSNYANIYVISTATMLYNSHIRNTI